MAAVGVRSLPFRVTCIVPFAPCFVFGRNVGANVNVRRTVCGVRASAMDALDVPPVDSARREIASRLDTGRASFCGCCVVALSIKVEDPY